MEENSGKQFSKKKEILSPKNDVVFHALFREENKELTEGLLSALLKENVKVITTDKDRYVNLKDPKQKYGILDLRAELEGGIQCNVEIQLEYYENESDRFLYYWADAYTRQLKKGEKYKKLNKTISIIILGHEIEELKGIENLGTKWQIRNEEEPTRLLTDRLEVVIIEMPKAIRQYKENKENKISQWMMFLDNPAQKEVVQIMDMNEEIRKAAEELNSMSEDDELRTMAELRLKGLRDEQAAIDYATKRGIEQGIEQGEKQGGKKKQVEIAKKMLNRNMDIKDIIEITGLTEEEINKI